MLIKDIKKDNRPMEKMLANGPDSLSNEELLAILIHTGTKKKSSLDISYEIINSVDNLSDLLNLSIKELIQFEGIKHAKACTIEAAIELTRRMIFDKKKRTQLLDHNDCINVLIPLISNLHEEVLIVLFLDSNLNLKSYKKYDGTTFNVGFPANDIIKEAIVLGARGVIISHNHPSGDPNPSDSDIEITEKFLEQLKLFNLILFDHIIIGNGEYFSYNECLSFSFHNNIKNF